MDQERLFSLSRRTLLAGGASAAAFAAIGGSPALASAPKLASQAPYYYRFALGGFEATIASDGPLTLPSSVFVGVPQEDVEKLLVQNFLPPKDVAVEQNILVVNTGSKLVMFDTGLGSAKLFGPNSGRLQSSLKAAGIDPKTIDAVVLSHAHPDHTWGILGDDGKPNFPNAQIYISQADYDFWTDLSQPAAKTDAMKPLFEGARKHLVPNRDRIVFVKDGQEFLPGIQAMATPGHTIGHNAYIITSAGKTLAFLGDTTNHPVALFQDPRIEFAYDMDGKQAVKSHTKILDMLATTRTPLLGYHFPWPGIGYAAKHGEGFQYHPAMMQMVL